MFHEHTYLKDISAGTPLGMCARVTVKYWMSEARPAQIIAGIPSECDTPAQFEIERVSCAIEIDCKQNPFARLCTGELHPDNWHYLGGEEAIELECRNRGSHLTPDDDNGWNYATEDEQDFYSIQNRNQ